MSSNEPPVSATGKETSPYTKGPTAGLQPGATVASVPDQTPYQLARNRVEKCNATIHRPINELKCARRTTGQGGGQPVFKDEEEPELPILDTSVLSPNLGAESGAVAEPQAKPSPDRGGDGDNLLADALGAVGQEAWNEFVLPPITCDANAAKNQVVGYQTLGLVCTGEEAS